jgi:hypothetical protein
MLLEKMIRNYDSLKNLIIQILGNELGIYTLPNKSKIPAIAIKQPTPYPEPGTTVSGLEVVIIPETNIGSENYLGSVLISEEIQLILNQWDNNRDTKEATNLIITNIQPHWKIKRIGAVVLPNWDLETIESRVVYLTESTSYRWRD